MLAIGKSCAIRSPKSGALYGELMLSMRASITLNFSETDYTLNHYLTHETKAEL